MKAKFYQVGGCVRDALLGVKSKDIDFSVEAESYEAMRAAIVERCGGSLNDPEDCKLGGRIIKVEKPEFATIRAVDPVLGGVDFVLCRKDGTYSDGRRPDSVEMGTLLDDLSRRDFTVNAIARADDGLLVDPFHGQRDLSNNILRCVGDTERRMTEDALRILRAIRFSITKGFAFDLKLDEFLSRKSSARLLACVSIERVREELLKCFDADTYLTLTVLENYRHIREVIFSRNLKLTPTIFVAK